MNMHTIKNLLFGLIALCPLGGTAQIVDTNQVYEIHTLNGLAMDNQESVDTGTKIFISKRVQGKESQVWQFVPVKDNIYCIVSPLSRQAIDNSGDSEKEQSVIQWSSDFNKNI